MKYEIRHRLTGKVLFAAEINCEENAPDSLKKRLAVLWALENGASLEEASLRGANLRGVNLRRVNLRRAYLNGAYLNGADLRGANLAGANLNDASLNGASLNGVNLDGAIFDFSVWPLHCGSFYAKADDRLVAQLICHVARLDVSNCSDKVSQALKDVFTSEAGKYLMNLFCEYRYDVNKAEEE